MSIPVCSSDDSHDLQELFQDAEELLSRADSFELNMPSNDELTQSSPDFDRWADVATEFSSPPCEVINPNKRHKSAAKLRKRTNKTSKSIRQKQKSMRYKPQQSNSLVDSMMIKPTAKSILVSVAVARQKFFVGEDAAVNQLTAIPADDIRRQFVILFMEAINSGEINDLKALLTLHSTKDITVVSRCYDTTSERPTRSRHGSPYVEVRGLDAVVTYLEGALTSIPDAIIECLGTQICAFDSGKSTISCKFSLQCTKTVELVGDHEDILILPMPKDMPANPLGDKVLILPLDDKLNINIHSVPTEKILLRGCRESDATRLDTEGILLFLIDSSKKIKRIEIIFSIKRRYRVPFSD